LNLPHDPDPEASSMIAGWGGMSVPGRELHSEDLEAITAGVPLTRGLGRSYGDSSLPPPGRPCVAVSSLADRLLSFDAQSGVVRAEAGLSLCVLNRLFLSRGFYSPVTPGTQQITLGGMVAADVHGKNHHQAGTIGAHLVALRIRTGAGEIVECSASREADLFRATIGGMGLTGHILEVELRLEAIPSPWILAESRRIADIDDFLEQLKSSGADWPYTMGWIDCVSRGRHLGRGVLLRGRWATTEEAPERLPGPLRRPSVPFMLPSWALSRVVVRTFNGLKFRLHPRRARRGIQHPEAFLYPLDAIGSWNRLYGRRGFTQYQCVLPDSAGLGSARRLLDVLTSQGRASMLCVIKDCGAEGAGLLSFPRSGISIAIDVPVRDDTQAVIDALNEQVIAEGGRVYLAKDQFTRPEHLRRMEPRLDEWLRVRRKWDPEARLRSAQSVRLLGDAP
jgi:FAD/FMN-containing dehydrogenase